MWWNVIHRKKTCNQLIDGPKNSKITIDYKYGQDTTNIWQCNQILAHLDCFNMFERNYEINDTIVVSLMIVMGISEVKKLDKAAIDGNTALFFLDWHQWLLLIDVKSGIYVRYVYGLVYIKISSYSCEE